VCMARTWPEFKYLRREPEFRELLRQAKLSA
jgi:hypothetical protein